MKIVLNHCCDPTVGAAGPPASARRLLQHAGPQGRGRGEVFQAPGLQPGAAHGRAPSTAPETRKDGEEEEEGNGGVEELEREYTIMIHCRIIPATLQI